MTCQWTLLQKQEEKEIQGIEENFKRRTDFYIEFVTSYERLKKVMNENIVDEENDDDMIDVEITKVQLDDKNFKITKIEIIYEISMVWTANIRC